MLITGCVFAADAKAATDPKDVKVVYSADDGICQPLAKLYSNLNHTHTTENQEGTIVQTNLDWEDIYPERFASIGLKSPHLLKDISYLHDGRPGKWLAGYYKLNLSPATDSQLIYIEDIPVGDYGSAGTNLWVLKPGVSASITIDPSGYGPPEKSPGDNPNDVALAVLFSDGPNQDDSSPYPLVMGPYPFYAAANSIMLGTGAVIQRVFLYHNQATFIARPLSFSTSLLYRISGNNEVKPICEFADNEAVAYQDTLSSKDKSQ